MRGRTKMGEGSGPIRTPRAAIRAGAEGGARGKRYFFSWLLSQGTFSHLNAHPVRDERGAVAWPGREAEAQLGVVCELGRSVSDEALHLHEHRATLVRLLEPQDVALTAPGKLNLYRTAGEGRVDFHGRRAASGLGGFRARSKYRIDTMLGELNPAPSEVAGTFTAQQRGSEWRTVRAIVSVTQATYQKKIFPDFSTKLPSKGICPYDGWVFSLAGSLTRRISRELRFR